MSPDSLLDRPMTGKSVDKAMFEQYAQNNFSLRVDIFNHDIEDKSLALLFMHLNVCQSHCLIIKYTVSHHVVSNEIRSFVH